VIIDRGKNPSIQKSMLYKEKKRKGEKGGSTVVQHEQLPKDHEIRLPRRASSTAPPHHTRHGHDQRHKYDNHILPNETHSVQNDLNVALESSSNRASLPTQIDACTSNNTNRGQELQ
jgi:hypothetical protein